MNDDFSFTRLRDVFGPLGLEYDLADTALLCARLGARDGREDGIYCGITVLDAATGVAKGDAQVVLRTDNNEAAQATLRNHNVRRQGEAFIANECDHRQSEIRLRRASFLPVAQSSDVE